MEGHPQSHENERDREKAYLELHRTAQHKLDNGRTLNLDIEGTPSTLQKVDLRLHNGEFCNIVKITDGTDQPVETLVIVISHDPSNAVFGHTTQYESANKGIFRRKDMTPGDNQNLPRPEEVDISDPHQIHEYMVYADAEKDQDVNAGLDGFPITAQEAETVTDLIIAAEISPVTWN